MDLSRGLTIEIEKVSKTLVETGSKIEQTMTNLVKALEISLEKKKLIPQPSNPTTPVKPHPPPPKFPSRDAIAVPREVEVKETPEVCSSLSIAASFYSFLFLNLGDAKTKV